MAMPPRSRLAAAVASASHYTFPASLLLSRHSLSGDQDQLWHLLYRPVSRRTRHWRNWDRPISPSASTRALFEPAASSSEESPAEWPGSSRHTRRSNRTIPSSSRRPACSKRRLWSWQSTTVDSLFSQESRAEAVYIPGPWQG